YKALQDKDCRHWVDSVMDKLSFKEKVGQLFIYTIAPVNDILLGRVILNTEQKVKESQSQRDKAFFGKGGIIRGDFRFDCQLPAGEFGGDGRWCAGGPAQ
uniref:hypothetical protein n=1 Tax=Dysosmobacter welbionis TaxID=2093857 RepID=UPI003FEDD2DC